MKHSTFRLLQRAYLGDVDREALEQAESTESSPFDHRTIQLVTDRATVRVPWDVSKFTSEFRTGKPRDKMEETVFAFLVRLLAIVKEEELVRSLRKPESCFSTVTAWCVLLKQSIFAITVLLFDARWTSARFLELDALVLDLVATGQISKLRQFFTETLDIPLTTGCTTDAERNAPTLNFLHVGQFGSAFWRMLHWMAEAIDREDGPNVDAPTAKDSWRQLVTSCLYRALRCGVCMNHMKQVTEQLKSQLLDESTRYGPLWFNIHNKVNTWKSERGYVEATYSEQDYESDARVYRAALPK